jgi:hypothetical protein
MTGVSVSFRGSGSTAISFSGGAACEFPRPDPHTKREPNGPMVYVPIGT